VLARIFTSFVAAPPWQRQRGRDLMTIARRDFISWIDLPNKRRRGDAVSRESRADPRLAPPLPLAGAAWQSRVG